MAGRSQKDYEDITTDTTPSLPELREYTTYRKENPIHSRYRLDWNVAL